MHTHTDRENLALASLLNTRLIPTFHISPFSKQEDEILLSSAALEGNEVRRNAVKSEDRRTGHLEKERVSSVRH